MIVQLMEAAVVSVVHVHPCSLLHAPCICWCVSLRCVVVSLVPCLCVSSLAQTRLLAGAWTPEQVAAWDAQTAQGTHQHNTHRRTTDTTGTTNQQAAHTTAWHGTCIYCCSSHMHARHCSCLLRLPFFLFACCHCRCFSFLLFVLSFVLCRRLFFRFVWRVLCVCSFRVCCAIHRSHRVPVCELHQLHSMEMHISSRPAGGNQKHTKQHTAQCDSRQHMDRQRKKKQKQGRLAGTAA